MGSHKYAVLGLAQKVRFPLQGTIVLAICSAPVSNSIHRHSSDAPAVSSSTPHQVPEPAETCMLPMYLTIPRRPSFLTVIQLPSCSRLMTSSSVAPVSIPAEIRALPHYPGRADDAFSRDQNALKSALLSSSSWMRRHRSLPPYCRAARAQSKDVAALHPARQAPLPARSD